MSHQSLAFFQFIVYKPWRIILLCLLTVVCLGYGAKDLRFNNNYRVFFADQNPQLAAFEEIERVYTKTDNVLFTIKPRAGDVFQPRVLKLVQQLTHDSWKLPYSQRVDSITNFQHTYATEDDLIVSDLVENDALQLSKDELSHIKKSALSEPLLAGKIINRNALATGVNVTINLPGKNQQEVPQVASVARAMVEKYRSEYPEIELHASGMVFMNNAFMESAMLDMQTLTPLMFVTLIVITVLLVRSISATFATLLVILFSAIAAMGFAGWLRIPLTPPSAMTPTIVLTLAIADSIHIIISLKKLMQQGLDKKTAILESLRINFQPVLLTSLTTVVGFLSLNFSESPPFWHLGNMTAFGVTSAFVFSILLLPALLSILPIRFKHKHEGYKSLTSRLGEFVVKHNRLLLVSCLIITSLVAWMINRIELNDQFVQYFDDSIEFRSDTEFMMSQLSGIYTIEYSIPGKGKESISDPEYLYYLEKFTEWLRKQPEVDHVYAISDIFKRLNKNMHADNPEWYRIPENAALASQYLLLYEFSLPYGLDLNDRISIDKSTTRLTVTLKDMSSRQLRAFKDHSEQWLKINAPDYMYGEATSPSVMFSFISNRNVKAMIKGNLISLLLISTILIVALRSISTGVVSVIPNLAPIALGFGIWGMLIGQINMAAAFAFAACLGIIVDDTVHFLSKYLRAKREKGLNARAAVLDAFNTVGSAMAVTTFILIGGFTVMTQSGFQMNSYLGLLTAIVIGSALLLDFFLLPPLLIALEDFSGQLKLKRR